ncbi:hypothetical protein [Photobacterium halotolerans]|uniref:hypothetical protein n=1 Tax=Photobacterium halotolerans TaxID=265726 RepID=UPI000403B39D|nr:hypothetical protein [Photobacterium halotolerans]
MERAKVFKELREFIEEGMTDVYVTFEEKVAASDDREEWAKLWILRGSALGAVHKGALALLIRLVMEDVVREFRLPTKGLLALIKETVGIVHGAKGLYAMVKEIREDIRAKGGRMQKQSHAGARKNVEIALESATLKEALDVYYEAREYIPTYMAMSEELPVISNIIHRDKFRRIEKPSNTERLKNKNQNLRNKVKRAQVKKQSVTAEQGRTTKQQSQAAFC